MFSFVCKMCTNTNLLLNSQWIGGAREGKERRGKLQSREVESKEDARQAKTDRELFKRR
jgi:hypothetical protein